MKRRTPGRLLIDALHRAEQYRRNPNQSSRHRRDRITNTGRLTQGQCLRLVDSGEFFGPERVHITMRVLNNCHGNSIDLVREDFSLQLWTGMAFSDGCSDGGTNGWFAHSWAMTSGGSILETSPRVWYTHNGDCEINPWPGYFGVQLLPREIDRWLLRDYSHVVQLAEDERLQPLIGTAAAQ